MDTNENARLAALRKYRILDAAPEKAFDDLTMLASHISGTPIALLSLVDADRQWFKSRVGVSAQQTSRAVSFCAHAILQSDLFVVGSKCGCGEKLACPAWHKVRPLWRAIAAR